MVPNIGRAVAAAANFGSARSDFGSLFQAASFMVKVARYF
jgi:hypothetical protein